VHVRYFGDSYDIVKQSLLRWLAPLGPWAAHPMFTEPVPPDDAAAFSRFLGVPLLSDATLESRTDRHAYFEPARSWKGHVFLDPDTGLRLQELRGRRGCVYVFAAEVNEILGGRPDSLVLVFDQSLQRGREAEGLAGKLEALAGAGIRGFAYRSHAAFLLLGLEERSVRAARDLLLRESRLPASRLVAGP